MTDTSQPLIRACLLTVAVLLAAACGSGEAVTVTKIETETVERTTTVVETVTAEAEPVIYVPMTGGIVEFMPSEIFVGNSPGFVIEEWQDYGKPTARGRGWVDIRSCDPDCASGGHTRIEVMVRLTNRVPCKGVPAYAYLTVEESSNEALVAPGEIVVLSDFCREGEE